MSRLITPARFPRRVVCLTEESVETLYLLGLQERIVGVSAFVRRPASARRKKIVTSFIKANLEAIVQLKPDLILGYSDIQKEIAKELISLGFPVWIANHHSLQGILDYVLQLGALFGKKSEAQRLIQSMSRNALKIERQSKRFSRRPKVYFEEWEEPMIHGIGWVTEAIWLAGGDDILAQPKKTNWLAKDRFTTLEKVREKEPDIVFGCWCGKPFDRLKTMDRLGPTVPAVQSGWVRELPPEVFLQPGPALFLDGIPSFFAHFSEWSHSTC